MSPSAHRNKPLLGRQADLMLNPVIRVPASGFVVSDKGATLNEFTSQSHALRASSALPDRAQQP
jgi:hypothetical protein